MNKLKRFLPSLLAFIMAFSLVFSFACTDGNPEQLAAPTITLNGNVISWSAVEHATGYEVFQGSTSVATTDKTSYTITLTEAGSYTFTVTATSTDEHYTTSPASNSVTYTVKPAPVTTTLSSIALDTKSVKTDYLLGQPFTAEGLVVTANYTKSDGTSSSAAVSLDKVKIDASEYENAATDGKYKIYVSYTESGKTVKADYEVNVTATRGANVILKDNVVANIQLSEDKTEGDIELSEAAKTITLDPNQIEVRTPDSKGVIDYEQAPLAAGEYDVKVFKGKEEVTTFTGLGSGVYQIWVTLKEDVEGIQLKGFALVYVINNVVELTWNEDEATTEQTAGADQISSTWKFTAKYATGDTKDVTDKVVFTDLDTKTVGESKTATATYSEANQRGVVTEKTVNITYTIKAKPTTGSDVHYSVVYDVEDLTDADKTDPEWTVTWASGLEDTDGKVTVDYSGNTTGKKGSKKTEDGEKEAIGSVEFKDSKQITITVAEGVTVESLVLWVSHGTTNDSSRTATLSGGTLEAGISVTPQATDSSSPKLYKLEATNIGAGTYKLSANNTMRLYEIDIDYTVKGAGVASTTYTVTHDVEDLTDADKTDPEWTVTWANNLEDTDGNVTVDYSGNTTGKKGSKKTEDGLKEAVGSVEFKDSKQITITVAEGVTVESLVLWVSHGTTNDSSRTATLSGGTLTDPITVTPLATESSSPKLYKLEATNIGAGTYKLSANNTMRLYEIDITYTVSAGGGSVTEPAEPLFVNFSELVGSGVLSVATYDKEVELAADDYSSVSLLAATGSTVSVDANGKNIDSYSFTHRVKLGGKGTDTARSIKIELAGAATVTVYMMSSNGSEARQVGLWTGTFDAGTDPAAIATQEVGGSALEKHEYTIAEAGTYYLAAVTGGTNVYGILITPTV